MEGEGFHPSQGWTLRVCIETYGRRDKLDPTCRSQRLLGRSGVDSVEGEKLISDRADVFANREANFMCPGVS
jgi:hypothetical protein